MREVSGHAAYNTFKVSQLRVLTPHKEFSIVGL